MVYINEEFFALIHGSNLLIDWSGVITLKNGSTVSFGMANIKNGSGELVMCCSPDNSIELGGGYAAVWSFSMKEVEVDRYQLTDGIIDLTASITQRTFYSTWDDVGGFSWSGIGARTWADTSGEVTCDVPMGLYIIKEAMRTADSIKITSYDFMIKLDVNLPASFTDEARTVYDWLALAGTACGIAVGSTREDIRQLPNGNRVIDFSSVDTEVKTWRDLVIQLAAAAGAVAVIDRQGQLVLKPYTLHAVDGIPAGYRYSSEFSEYQSYYTGLYATYQEENVSEYHRNTTEEEDTGLVINLGANPFLQITNETRRKAAGQAIIDAMAGIKYVPFQVSMPFNPTYEPMDVLQFFDNQTEVEDIAPITKIVFRVNDKMQIICGGGNPALNEVQTRESKAIERMSSDSYSGDLFWMVMDNAPAENAVTISAKDTPTKIGEALFYCQKNKSMLDIKYTATFLLAVTTLVKVHVYVDSTLIYTTEENLWPNENRLTVTTGYELSGKGSHSVSVYLEITDSTLDVGGGGVLLAKSISSNGLYIAADDGVYGYSEVQATVGGAQGYYTGVAAEAVEPENPTAAYEDDNTYTVSAAENPDYDVSAFFCRLSTHAGDGASFNGRWFTRTEDTPPLLFINVSNSSGYSSYGAISNHDTVPAQSYNSYGDLVSQGAITFDGNTFYLYTMRGWWSISRSGIAYTLNGESVKFPDACYIYHNGSAWTIKAAQPAYETALRQKLAEFAQLG